MSGELNPIEEQAFDALLDEAHNKGTPPDLSREILARLREEPSIVSIRQAPVSVAASPRKYRLGLVSAIVAAVAASFLTGIWLRGDHDIEGGPIAAGDTDPLNVDPGDVTAPDMIQQDGRSRRPDLEAVVQSGEVVTDVEKDTADHAAPKRPRGIPLVVTSDSDLSTGSTDDPQRIVPPGSDVVSEPVTLVSQRVDADVHDYWQAIGIEPSTAVSDEAWVSRMSATLGIQLSPDGRGNVDQLRVEITDAGSATELARRWLSQITEGGLSRIDQPARDALIEDVAACLRGERRLDQLLASWISGQSENTSSWYAAMSAGAGEKSQHNTLVRRMASVSMNVDLRCTRCHDALIKGDGRQVDYWSFAAFLRSGVKRSGGKWSINQDDAPAKPVFYELPDGRQKVAEPGITSSWLTDNERVTNLQEFSQRIINEETFARGVVNSLWQLVHARPLRGQVIDTMSAPHNESLDRLEGRLTQDLVQSGFDVSRTLALIIVSPTANRSIPTPLLAENALVANESDVRGAMHSVDAFAAALPPQKELSTSGRLDLAMRSIGAKLDDLSGDDFVFAQRIGSDGSDNKPTREREVAPTGFPERSVTSFPVQWLERVEGFESRVEHLGYLAGMNQVPKSVHEAAVAMRKADVSEELSLHRVWWLLRP